MFTICSLILCLWFLYLSSVQYSIKLNNRLFLNKTLEQVFHAINTCSLK